jgi:hypothetical protein
MKWKVVQSLTEGLQLLRTSVVSSNVFQFIDQYKLLEGSTITPYVTSRLF